MTESFVRLTAALADRYRIERELGQGGMATVYLAEDLKHKRNVALKVLKPELAAVLGAERFVQEITTTAALQHPHILPLFDSGTADGFLFYVMPFIDGETLRNKLDRETQLGVDEAVKITTEIADALDYAHRNGVIHRDIKPENILLHDGRPMVADFGIALAVSAAAGGRMTETGLSLGTPHYMSPEQATAEKDLTNRSDVYSLGSVLYEMLTGNPPHTGASAQQIIMKIVTEEARPVTSMRKSVPSNIAAAVLKSLEKLPADRFETAKAFADALGDASFTIPTGPGALPTRVTRNSWKSLSLGLAAALAVATLWLGWSLTRVSEVRVPSEYDVGLSGAEMDVTADVSFAVSPEGDFVVYQALQDGPQELWYRSLLDATTHRIDGTEGACLPTLSPDGTQLAFLRTRGSEWTVEVMPVEGGTATTLGRGHASAAMHWLTDGRIFLVEGDGNRARWLDPGGAASTALRIQYCIMPALLPDPNSLFCGGGGNKAGYQIDLRDSTSGTPVWTNAKDSSRIFGSHFRVIDGRYLTYVSIAGDLLATSIDLSTGRAGRSVRMVTGLGRRAYTGAGTYAISASGTLVFAHGINHAVGHLVSLTDGSLDTLPVGREAFLRWAINPDGRRLAAVVEGLEGEELRIYDLDTGRHIVWLRGPLIRQPTWSPRGELLVFRAQDSVFVGSPDAASPPELIIADTDFEGFTWLPDDRLVGVDWGPDLVVVAHMDQRPVVLDTILGDASFVRVSPDGRWIAYNSADITALWLEPFPRTGKRWQVAGGEMSMEDAQWLSPSEFVFTTDNPKLGVDRVTVDPRADPPFTGHRRWLETPRFVETAGPSFGLTPDGRVLYVQGAEETPVSYLRVIPNWVERMKQAVDEANQ